MIAYEPPACQQDLSPSIFAALPLLFCQRPELLKAVRGDRRGERLILEVADEGSGIATEDRGKLFLPFFSRKKRGTGMGLAIVHRIVSDHNGAIRVADNLPRGTVFTMELPAR